MVCQCKGGCEHWTKLEIEGKLLRTSGGTGHSGKNYNDGYKRCKRCEYYLQTEDLRCKCCGGLLKLRSMKKKIDVVRM